MDAHITASAFGSAPGALIAVTTLFCFLATITITLRVYCRFLLTKGYGLDDWILLAAFVLFIVDCALLMEQGRVEIASEIEASILRLSRLELSFFGIYIVDQIFLKFALAAFFHRIVQDRRHRLFIILVTSVYALYSAGFALASLFRCGAIDVTSPTYFETSCTSWNKAELALNVTHAVLNAVVDVSFAILPIAIVTANPAMSAKRKISVCGLIAMAVSGSVVSVIRIPFIAGDKEIGPGVFKHEAPVALLSVAETGIGICCLSVATLRPLARVWISKGKGVVEDVHGEMQIIRVKRKLLSFCSSGSWSLRSSMRKGEPECEVGTAEDMSESIRHNDERVPWWTTPASGGRNLCENEDGKDRYWGLEKVATNDHLPSDDLEKGLQIVQSDSAHSESSG